MAIRSWACDATREIFEDGSPRGFPKGVLRAASRKLAMLDAAVGVADLRVPPGNRLEKLKGDRAGQWSIRVKDQYRVCFVWRSGHAYEVEIVDYH